MGRRVGRWILLCSLACGGRSKDGSATPDAADAEMDPAVQAWIRQRGEAAARGPGGGFTGRDKESPLAACGPRGSYALIADHACPDGGRPFDGDVARAADSRAGNVGPNSRGHIIDLYEVPCKGGAEKVFVDMYDCDNARPSRSELEVQYYIHEAFLAGDHARFIKRCDQEEARGPSRISLLIQACVPAMPISLRESGQPERAAAWLAKYCGGTPPPTAEQPKRFRYLASVLEAHDLLRERQGRPNERAALTPELAKTCDVDPAAFAAWLASEAEDE